ncbi:hypothetical protein N8457_00110 [bacterium]|nr:hypothetical protein [bacterium]
MKYENEMFHDLMGIVIETNDKWLDKKLNGHICYKGGGSRQTTQAAPEIPKEFKPFAKQYAGQLTRASRRGDTFGQMAAVDPALQQAQEAALGRAGQVGELGQAGIQAQQEALRGEGLFGARDLSAQQAALSADAKRRLGMGTAQRQAGAAMGGGAGGARAALAQQQAESQASTQLAGRLAELEGQDLAARRAASAAARGETGMMQKAGMADIDVLRGVGKERGARAQQKAEQKFQALQQQAGLFTGIPMGQSSTTRGGGGK